MTIVYPHTPDLSDLLAASYLHQAASSFYRNEIASQAKALCIAVAAFAVVDSHAGFIKQIIECIAGPWVPCMLCR